MDTTVITICWNSARRIERCVESVLAQEQLPSEYIFVDGGSTDGTLVLLENLSSRLETKGITTRIIHQVRREGEAGIPSAWNQGID
ncbi:MAG: glycosyltransferase, partial [Victivallales bacterium]|nr:glycosyltransferase [Victivallales bacterium]